MSKISDRIDTIKSLEVFIKEKGCYPNPSSTSHDERLMAIELSFLKDYLRYSPALIYDTEAIRIRNWIIMNLGKLADPVDPTPKRIWIGEFKEFTGYLKKHQRFPSEQESHRLYTWHSMQKEEYLYRRRKNIVYTGNPSFSAFNSKECMDMFGSICMIIDDISEDVIPDDLLDDTDDCIICEI